MKKKYSGNKFYLTIPFLLIILVIIFVTNVSKNQTANGKYFSSLANEADRYSKQQLQSLGSSTADNQLVKDCYETYTGYPPGLISPSKENPLKCEAKRTAHITVPADLNSVEAMLDKTDLLAKQEGFSGHSGNDYGTENIGGAPIDLYYYKKPCTVHINYPGNSGSSRNPATTLEYVLSCDNTTLYVPNGFSKPEPKDYQP